MMHGEWIAVMTLVVVDDDIDRRLLMINNGRING